MPVPEEMLALAPRALSERLMHLGFSSALHLTPEEAEQRYFAGRTDGLRVPLIEQLLLGTV
jgi:hypothetical protein